jgi:hypothetical protein
LFFFFRDALCCSWSSNGFGLYQQAQTFSYSLLLSHRLELVCKDAFMKIIVENNVNVKTNLTKDVNGLVDFLEHV